MDIAAKSTNTMLSGSPACKSAPLKRTASAMVLVMLATFLGPTVSAVAAELTVEEGVVVKFGSGAGLVVRDKATLKDGAVFTTVADDNAAGQTGATPGVPTMASWNGIRVEKSSGTSGGFSATGATIRYAGQSEEAGLSLRGVSPPLSFVQITNSSTGLRLLEAAAPTISGSSFLSNLVGIDADGNSNPNITSTQISGNSTHGLLNKTPATLIQARGNWWGNASGPKDPVGNPQGTGDLVSTGVNYGAFLATAPLLNPTIRVASPAPYYEQNTLTLLLSCVNATEYRIGENDVYSGVAFSPLPNGKLTLNYATSAGEGRKTIGVQYRNASGALVTASLTGGILIDSAAPVVALNNPAPGSVISQPIAVEANVSDAAGVTKVDFYLDGVLVSSKTAPTLGSLYSYDWNTDASATGSHTLRVVAFDEAGRSSEQSRSVTISRTPPPPDTDGPVISALAANGSAVVDGVTTLTRNSVPLTVNSTDRSGVARVEFVLGSQSAVTASANGNGNFSASLNLANVPNGTYTLTTRAIDSLANTSTATYNIVVAHAAPDVPSITAPVAGLVTRNATLTVSGTAQAGNTVQLVLAGANAGSSVGVGADGRFTGSVTLAPGSNSIQAQAIDVYGSSALSAAVVVNLDTTVPTAASNLTALSQALGKIRLNWSRSTDANVSRYDLYRSASAFTDISQATKVNGSALNAQTSTYEDIPGTDGTWYYRVVAVNSVGTPSLPTNQVQSTADNTMPKAMAIAYTPLGKVDAATGRIGQGRVNVVLTVNEQLQATPYLAVVPAGGSPIVVNLNSTSTTEYVGSFTVDANTPTGVANVLFSARDIVGNRGTDIANGATLNIDTEGPVLTGITLAPGAPIKNDPAATLQATLTFSKATKTASTPALAYTMLGTGRPAIAVTGLTQLSPISWGVTFQLPGDVAQAGPETLAFNFQAIDSLDNVSTRVTAANRFQIYQGSLPPLDVPLGLTGKAVPGGKVNLSWSTVDGAFAYQIYRQGPGQNALQAWQRASGTSYVDQTTQDGAYKYAVATVRQSNAQESVSGQSAAIDINASATAPGAPQNMTLQLTGQGIVVRWLAPLASNATTYNVYRTAGTSITSTNGLTPYKSGIKQLYNIDPSPSPVQGAYAVTALDAAGNESALSNSSYLNASLLPVSNLQIVQADTNLPVVSWNAPNGNVAGYNIYVGPDNAKVKLNANLMTGTSFVDTGYTSGERRYTVSTVDASAVELGRSLLLPNISSQVVSGLPIKRGIMNKLQVQLTNTSSAAQDGVTAVVRTPIDKNSTQFKDHRSESTTLGANETKLVTVVVGGYTDMPSLPLVQLSVEVVPNEGELVKISRQQRMEVTDGALVVGINTEEFVRGATGKVRLAVENTSDVEIELLTAINGGTGDSTELRFKLIDADGNVLATQAYRQAIGANVVTLVNGQTVARIPAGASYTSDVFAINVPSSAPNTLRVKLEVDAVRYHSGQPDQVVIGGRGSEKSVSLAETAYVGEISNVTPLSSFGEQDIVITGRALDRRTNAPLPSTRLKLILNQQGFERVFGVLTDANGSFTYTFKPTITDSGLYKVSAVHPDITDRPEQKAFTINRVAIGPNPFKVDVPKNYTYSIPLQVKSGPGTSGRNLQLTLEPSAQPTGQVPVGINVQLPAVISIGQNQTLNMPVVFSANNDAQPTGSLIFNLYSDERPQGAGVPLGQVRVNYSLSEAKPNLVSTPSFLETGLARGGNEIETLTVQNNGLQDALNLQFTLTKPDNSAAPAWVAITSNPNGNLAVGARKSVDVSFTPTNDLPEGIYEFRIKVQGDNVPVQSLNVYASITQSGQGNVLFRASDIYTGTLNKQGQLIQGLAGTSISLQNEDVPSVKFNLTTDSLGEAYFQNVPAGRYQWRGTASNHQEKAGRISVKPGVTNTEPLFLDYNLITVEWSVREITINDRYEITLDATFETDVPAAVVVMQPASVNLPKMNPGDVFYGELVLTNHGLIRADNVKQKLPVSDPYFRYEFLVNVPDTLNAKQRVTIPYRVVALQSLDPGTSGQASGGGCYSYGAVTAVSCDYICKNGVVASCGAQTSFFSVGGSCGSTAGGGISFGSGGGGGGGAGGGGFGGGSSISTSIPLKGKKCVGTPDGKSSCN